jgi:hypothetical protein
LRTTSFREEHESLLTALHPQIRAGADIGWTALLRKLNGIAPKLGQLNQYTSPRDLESQQL